MWIVRIQPVGLGFAMRSYECPECEREETVVVKHDRNRADAHAVASVPGRSVSWFPCRDGGPVGFPRRLGRPTPSWN